MHNALLQKQIASTRLTNKLTKMLVLSCYLAAISEDVRITRMRILQHPVYICRIKKML